MKSIITDWDYIYKHEEIIGHLLETPFFKKGVHLCWNMAIQDPVMYLPEDIQPDTVYNRDVYKEFVQSGDKVKYVGKISNHFFGVSLPIHLHLKGTVHGHA